MPRTEYKGIQIDYDRDELFDSLGLQRLKESYMKEEEGSPQERFAFVSSTLVLIQNMHNDYMNMLVNIGYPILHLSYHMVEVKRVCLFHVS